ncbi:hypothetical protein COO72_09040 [Bifidobacterium callitrichos]|nr:hypothetical protein COO72_09040 [Bifidobacterium callitrichos]
MCDATDAISPTALAMDMLSDPDFLEASSLLSRANIFDMVGMSRQEIRHSSFLAWILDPSNPHGLRDLFIRRLLAELYKAYPKGYATLAVEDLSNLTVERETTTGTKKRIDLLAYDSNQRLVLCIENKVDSGLHDRQLDTYYKYTETTYQNWRYRIYVLLSPSGDPAPDDQCNNPDDWIPISYTTIAHILEGLMPYAEPHCASIIDDYIRMLKKENIVEDHELDQLAKNLYQKYQPVFDMVYARYINNDGIDGELRSIYLAVLNEYKAKRRFSWCQGLDEPGRYLGFTTQAMDQYLLNRQDRRGSWGENSRTYTYWVYPPLGKPTIKLELGPLNQSDATIAQMNRLAELTNKKPVLKTDRYRKIISIRTGIDSSKYDDRTDIDHQYIKNQLYKAIDKMLNKEKELLGQLESAK